MKFRNKIKQLEKDHRRNEREWILNASDAELEALASSRNISPAVTEWLKTLTDDELIILRDGKPGAAKIRSKFNEYQQKN